jgi:hypothetical protein
LQNSETTTTVGPTSTDDDAYAKTDELEAHLKTESYRFKITPVSVDVAGNEQGRQQGNGAGDSLALAQRIGPVEDLSMAIAIGLLLGAGLFIAAAVLGERNALWIPGVVLIAAAVGSLVS